MKYFAHEEYSMNLHANRDVQVAKILHQNSYQHRAV